MRTVSVILRTVPLKKSFFPIFEGKIIYALFLLTCADESARGRRREGESKNIGMLYDEIPK